MGEQGLQYGKALPLPAVLYAKPSAGCASPPPFEVCMLAWCLRTPVHVPQCVQVLQQLERRAGLQHKFVGRVGKHAVESDDRWV
jgi:hypothetical protein